MHATLRYVSFFALLSSGTLVLGQSTTGTVTGTITDPSGSSVPNATIMVASEATGVNRQTKSSESGNYTVSLLPTGIYRVTVTSNGFKPVTRTSIELKVDQVARIDFTLEVGAMSEKVEVTSDAPLLDSETSSLGQVVNQDKVVNLPLNGRMTFRLVNLTPGILTPGGSGGQFGDISVGTFDDANYSINGGRSQSNAVIVDGVPSNTGMLNLFTTIPSVDATQEFKVQSNSASAEYGRFGGGVVNVSTRGGTNRLHGDLFEFLRNNILNANDFFNKGAGNQTPAFHMNQFGGTIGGPVSLGRLYHGKDHTFFFANYEGTRWRRGAVYTATVPTLLERQGDFSQTLNAQSQLIQVYDPVTTRANPAGGFIRDPFAGNKIPQSRIDPVGLAILKFYPTPNLTGNAITHANNYINNAPTRVNKDDGAIRLDHNVTDNYRTFGRLEVTNNQLHQPDTFDNPATPGVGANGDIIFHYYTGAWDNTITASPTKIFNIRYGFARFYWARNTRSYGFDQTTLGLPASYVSQLQLPVFPTIGMDGGYAGMAGGSFIRTGQDTHSLLPSMTITKNKQTIKMGADVRLRRNNFWIIQNGGGSFNFARAMTGGPNPNSFAANAGSSVAAMLLGAASGGSVGTTPGVSLQNWYVSGYVQDDIKVSRKLTVNLGLRYETESPYRERRDTLAYFDANAGSPITNPAYPNLRGSVQYVGGNNTYPYSWDMNNFAPRVGLAYSITDRLVFRSAFGIFYAGLETNNDLNNYTPVNGTSFSGTTAYLGTLDGITPFRYVSNPYPTGLNVPAGRNAASMLGQSITSWDSSGRTPYDMQWNADFQYQVTRNLLVDAAYAGSRGSHFARFLDANALNPQYLSLQSQLNQLLPNPFYGQITTGTLSQANVARSQLLRPYPQYAGVGIINSPTADSSYNSILLKLEQRMTHGQSFLVSFTGAKLISNANNSLAGLGAQSNNATTPQNYYNLTGERSLSEQDQAKALSISYVAELPFGKGHALMSKGFAAAVAGNWSLSGMFTYKGGVPLVLTAPITGVATGRPNSTGQSAELSNGRTRAQEIAQWFNTSVFTLPPSYTFGNVARTLPDTRGPSLTNIDCSLVKNVAIRERLTMQIRGEAFNLFNVPHFFLPNTAYLNNQFGQINSTSIYALPRVLQFALKLKF